MVIFPPNYFRDTRDIYECRAALRTDKSYVNLKLKRLSDRETVEAFEIRRDLTPNPPDLRVSFNKLIHSIRARMGEVSRKSDLPEYLNAVKGYNSGVDGNGSSMDSFISNKVLPELLTTARVGVFCSRDAVPETLQDTPPMPKLVIVPSEDIINMAYAGNTLTKLLLSSMEITYKDGYPDKEAKIFEEYLLVEGGLIYNVYGASSSPNPVRSTFIPGLDFIPFSYITIDCNPVREALGTHNALLQISSSDFLFLNKSNYPIYVEQYDIAAEMQRKTLEARENRPVVDPESGEATKAKKKDPDQVELGILTGRRYPKGSEAPQFITPPTEHLRASEAKQEKLREQIRNILDVDSLSIDQSRKSADSKQEEKETLVGNIQALFDKLETLERAISSQWHSYFDVEDTSAIEYPQTLDLRSEKTRLESAKKKLEERDNVASATARKLLTQEAVRDLLPTISAEKLRIIEQEINAVKLHISAEKVISLLDKQGIHIEHAVEAMGMPLSEVDKILKYVEERMKFIAATQTGNMNGGPGSTGRPVEKPIEGDDE